MNGQVFKTYTNTNAKIAVYGGMIILLVSFGVPLILTPWESFQWHWSYLLAGAFISFFVYVVSASFLKFFIRFYISPLGLTIRKPIFHKRFIPYDEIENVALLDNQETYNFFLNEVSEQYGLKDNSDLSGIIYKIRHESPYYKYLTITPRGTSTGTGQNEQLQSLHIEAEMLVLKLRNGKLLFLSPHKIHTFYSQLSSYL